MSRRQWMALALFAAAVTGGALLDRRADHPPRLQGILVADLHVHPYPGDGGLTIAQLQREAVRRGIDVIGITPHNNRLGLEVARVLGTDPTGPIIVPGQEITSPEYHMIALGTSRLIDWRLPADQAIAGIAAQGGVAVAAHPVPAIAEGWAPAAQRRLHGAEVMHPLRLASARGGEQLDRFFERARQLEPSLAAIGSSDFHFTAPLGLCRTYLLTADRSAAGALDAIRKGHTVGQCGDGPLAGAPQNVATVHQQVARGVRRAAPSGAEKGTALLSLLALAILVLPPR